MFVLYNSVSITFYSKNLNINSNLNINKFKNNINYTVLSNRVK